MEVFTDRDRQRLQVALDLDISELRKDSDLWGRLERLECFDAEQGTQVTVRIQGYLDELDELDTVIAASGLDGSGAAITVSRRIDEFRESYSYERSQAAGYEERRDTLIYRIQRDLGYLRAGDGQIPLM
ncbi:MAG: hypothetical protein F6J87_06065 [Spirulina sp. SIO3F2]|nr:hypothetical protein [Spirulina sp. SIO3F2]